MHTKGQTPGNETNAQSSNEEVTDIEIDLQEFDVTAPLPTRVVNAREHHAYYIAAIMLFAFTATVIIAAIRSTPAQIGDNLKGIGMTFGQWINLVLCYFMVNNRRPPRS